MALPLVSICLPNLNSRPFLKERMESILGQTCTDWELIISDNYSDDGSWEYYQKFKDDARIQMFQSPRRGMYANWNECLRRATGRYCYVATSDDAMVPECLERLVVPLETLSDVRISVCEFQPTDEKGSPVVWDWFLPHKFLGDWMQIPSLRTGLTEFVLHAGFGSTIWFTMTSVLFRRDILKQTGLFRTDLGSRADEEWTLRACLASDIAFVPGKLATWRVHPAQATGNWTNQKQAAKWLYESVAAVLRDRRAGIPEEWRRKPGLIEALGEARRVTLYKRFDLTRWDVQRDPLRFWKDFWSALRYAPGLIKRELKTGFRWEEEETYDRIAHVQKLLEWTGVPWPPKPWSAG